MPRLLIPLAIVGVAVIVYALVECLMTPRHQVRSFPKAVWILVILLLPVVGGLLWLFLGRARRRGAAGPVQAPAPRSPDDDAAFLRQLDVQRRQQVRQAELDRREAELKAREQQTRGKDAGGQQARGQRPASSDPDLPEDPDAPGAAGPDGGR